jgi:hypothetical protein
VSHRKNAGDDGNTPAGHAHVAEGAKSLGAGHNNANQVVNLGRPQRARDTAANTRARTLPSGVPGPDRRPTGPRTAAHPTKPRDRGVRRENEAADTLTQLGYDVEQNPPTLANGKNPDYVIEGENFDCYAPESSNPEKIRNRLSQKLSEGQAERFILNMADTTSSLLGEVEAVLRRKPIAGLKEILVVKDGIVVPFYPFGE